MRKHNDGQGAAYTAMVAMGMLILAMLCGCNVEKRIAQARVDAVALDHAQNPCVSDSIFTTTQGETLVLIDTVYTINPNILPHLEEGSDKIYKFQEPYTQDTLKTTITITKHRIDTVMAVVVDKRLVNDYKDSVSAYKLKLAHLSGVNTQLRQTLAKVDKTATTRLIWLLSALAAILIGVVLWVVIKIRPL